MCKKLILLASFLLVLGTASVSLADLVAYWPLDEGTGGITPDKSGNGLDGTLVGGPTFVAGMFGQAIQFDGSNSMYVDCGTDPAFDITEQLTVAAWIKMDHVSDRQPIVNKEGDGVRGVGYRVESGGVVHVQLYVQGWTAAADKTDLNSTVNLVPNKWYHVAYTYEFVADGSSITRLYIDGEQNARTDTTVGPLTTNTQIQEIGRYVWSAGYQKFFNGLVDDVVIFNHVLSEEEIKQVMRSGPTRPGPASNPKPADGATDVPREVVLGWTPGIFAPPTNGHKVYLSENFNDVNDGIGGIAQDANSHAPQRLDFGTTYYWRVDEVNGPPDYTVHEGNVWSFTTEPVGYPIENITATASSAHQADMGPENTINGAGLDANDLHSTEETTMWLSSAEPLGAWIQYEFDKVYKLHQMWVWNSNQAVEPLVGFGFKDVTIEYSTNGTDYATLGTAHQFARAPGAPDYAHNTTIDLTGVAAKYVRLTANSNSGGIVPQYGLSEVRLFYIPVQAREPRPADGETDVSIGTIDEPADVTLGFRAGREAVKHNVYFSTDEQAVIDGTADVTTVTETSYGPLSPDLGQTYYWRVDEVNEAETPATWQGDLWNFTTQEYFILDDFESYNDLDPDDPESKRIFNVWVDGYEVPTNGSFVGYENPPFCERTIVHGGEQSMPLFYNNTGGAAYSEAELPLSPPQDWTAGGAKTLSLWFFGEVSNTAAQLYVKVNGSKVMYDGDASNLTRAAWQVWNIDLASLGTNLHNITKLSIGIDGNGASGKLYFDDISLYPSR